jgi:hypothetical protein
MSFYVEESSNKRTFRGAISICIGNEYTCWYLYIFHTG